MWTSGFNISVATGSHSSNSEYPEMEYLSSVQPTSLHDAKLLAVLIIVLCCVLDGHPKSQVGILFDGHPEITRWVSCCLDCNI